MSVKARATQPNDLGKIDYSKCNILRVTLPGPRVYNPNPFVMPQSGLCHDAAKAVVMPRSGLYHEAASAFVMPQSGLCHDAASAFVMPQSGLYHDARRAFVMPL